MKHADFIAKYPTLYHMAAPGSWPSIREFGLLSTRALVDLYSPNDSLRASILQTVRKQSIVLSAAGRESAVVRDQQPLKFLSQCLLPGVSVQDFLDELNGRVFFHVSESRLHRLLGARAYRNKAHDVLVLDTEHFLSRTRRVDLAPYNTGSVHVPNMPARGPSTFTPLEDYPWTLWRSRRGEENAVVELTVAHSADVADSVKRVERWSGGERIAELQIR